MQLGKIVYRFETPVYPGNILYINLVANYTCTNDCLFCSRPRNKKEFGKNNIYEQKAGSFLYLPKSPSVRTVLQEVEKNIKLDDREIAFIGLGEPLIYLPKIIQLIQKFKYKYPWVKIRIDTNGLVENLFRGSAQKLKKVGLDQIRISLNAISFREYNQLCRPKFKQAFPRLVSFIKDCLEQKIDTQVSFVVGFNNAKIKKRTKCEYFDFALSLGVKRKNIIFRRYIKPLD